MIVETIPEIGRLSAEEKLTLANELFEELDCGEDAPIDPAIVQLLEARMEHYRKHPATARSWEDVKKDLSERP